MLDSGERQAQSIVENIRRDHVLRYEFVAKRERGVVIVDAACGIGYGSKIMFDVGNTVYGIDNDQETIDFANKNYPGPVYIVDDLSKKLNIDGMDVAVCFETVEHIQDPKPLLNSLGTCKKLYVSVPNEDCYPHTKDVEYHYRHYTPGEFENLLNEAGWQIDEWHTQTDEVADVRSGRVGGRTILAVCSRRDSVKERLQLDQETKLPDPVPHTIAILGLGPSLEEFVNFTKRLGGTSAYCDEVWGINAVGDVLKCDRVFHMDDVRIQEIRSEAKPKSNIANMLKWIKLHSGPIYTSRTHPDYKGLVGLPIEAMLNKLKFNYFNSTAAWAIGYAIYIGVKKIALFGVDFTYKNSHDAEKGRACCEFWLGVAAAKGIAIEMPKNTSLMDACEDKSKLLYGYDTVDVDISKVDGELSLSFYEKEDLPTAAEVEYEYNHGIGQEDDR